ncbi:hypothetical protein JCM11641_007787 [Rhodosporidiobolus odoratus]
MRIAITAYVSLALLAVPSLAQDVPESVSSSQFWHERYHGLLSMAAYNDDPTTVCAQTFDQAALASSFPDSKRLAPTRLWADFVSVHTASSRWLVLVLYKADATDPNSFSSLRSPTMSSTSSHLDPFKVPLLPVSTFARDKASSLAPPGPSSPHRPSPTSTAFSRLSTPRRLFSIPLALASVLLIAYALHSSSADPSSSINLDYAARRASGRIWSQDRSSKQRISSAGTASCPEQPRTPLTAAEAEEKFKRATRPMPLKATTRERLDEWEFEAPGWGVEPGDWVRKNAETCPSYRIRPNQNGQMLENAHVLWASMNTTGLMAQRKEMIDYLRKREQEGAMSEKAWGKGKGLVFTAGNADTFSRVLLTLKMLHNHLHTHLPAEIFSFPGETPDPKVRAELESYNATFRVIETAVRDGSRTKNYHIKASAIIRSSFAEVLFLDSDNIPAASLMPADQASIPKAILDDAQNKTTPWEKLNGDGKVEEVWGKPAGLWEAKSYQRLGVIFWPDYWRTQPDNSIWAILGVPCRDEWEQEAGQILIDKRRNLDALLLAEWMMDSSRFKYWFNMSDGDKDMFRFAFLALRKRWGVPGRYVTVGALPRNTMSGFCGHTMLQNDHLGKPLFVHANLLKQIPSGVGKGYAWGRHRQLRTPPSSLSLQDVEAATSFQLEEEDPMTDDDVDCDMLANAGNDGFALGAVPDGPPGWRIRRRAVMEKGVRAGFHGGWVSALCIGTLAAVSSSPLLFPFLLVHLGSFNLFLPVLPNGLNSTDCVNSLLADYHYDDPRSEEDKSTAKLSVAAVLPNPDHKSLAQLAEDVDICYTAAPDGWESKWCDGKDVMEVVQWKDDPRLRDFEDAFFLEGGKLNGKGF